jgi:hypothetical protein
MYLPCVLNAVSNRHRKTALDVVGAGAAADRFGADKTSGLVASIVRSGLSRSR